MDREEWKRPDIGGRPDDGEEQAGQRNIPESGNPGHEAAGYVPETGDGAGAGNGAPSETQGEKRFAESASPSDSYYTVYSRPADSGETNPQNPQNQMASGGDGSREATVDYSSAAGTKESIRSPHAVEFRK